MISLKKNKIDLQMSSTKDLQKSYYIKKKIIFLIK